MGELKQALSALHAFERRTVQRQGLTTDLGSGVTPLNLFRIAGAIQVNMMFGHVTTLMDATANTLRLGWTPTVAGAPVWLCAASAAINADAVNTLYIWAGTIAGQLVPGTNIGIAGTELIPWVGNTILLPAGVIALTIGGGAAAVPGVIDWYILFTPMTDQSDVFPL